MTNLWLKPRLIFRRPHRQDIPIVHPPADIRDKNCVARRRVDVPDGDGGAGFASQIAILVRFSRKDHIARYLVQLPDVPPDKTRINVQRDRVSATGGIIIRGIQHLRGWAVIHAHVAKDGWIHRGVEQV